MKAKIKCVFYLPRRLYRIIEDIMPLFEDLEANDPRRGAMTRALEYIIQCYMESDDYLKKVDVVKRLRWKLFIHLSEKEKPN